MANIEEYKIKLKNAFKSLNQGRKNKSISLKQAYDLLERTLEETKDIKKQETDEEFAEDAIWIFIEYLWINSDLCSKWKQNKNHPTKEEFETLKKFSDRFETVFAAIKEEHPSVINDKTYSDLKEEIKSVKDFVKWEEVYQKSPSSNDNNGGNNTNNNDNADSNDNTNNTNGDSERKPSLSNFELEKQMEDLQSQLNTLEKELKKKQQQNPNSVDSQKEKREKDRLERELEKLKREKEENEKKLRDQNLQNNKNKDKFPYGLVIGGGAVIFLLLIAVFFWQRSRKN